MTKLSEWITEKYQTWEKSQGKPQSYYAFSRYLDVPHSDLTLWISGNSLPEGDDLVKLANRLGAEIYDILVKPRPVGQLQTMNSAFLNLPAAFRERLNNAIIEADQAINQHHLNPESIEAKQRVVRIFERWGFKISS